MQSTRWRDALKCMNRSTPRECTGGKTGVTADRDKIEFSLLATCQCLRRLSWEDEGWARMVGM